MWEHEINLKPFGAILCVLAIVCWVVRRLWRSNRRVRPEEADDQVHGLLQTMANLNRVWQWQQHEQVQETSHDETLRRRRTEKKPVAAASSAPSQGDVGDASKTKGGEEAVLEEEKNLANGGFTRLGKEPVSSSTPSQDGIRAGASASSAPPTSFEKHSGNEGFTRLEGKEPCSSSAPSKDDIGSGASSSSPASTGFQLTVEATDGHHKKWRRVSWVEKDRLTVVTVSIARRTARITWSGTVTVIGNEGKGQTLTVENRPMKSSLRMDAGRTQPTQAAATTAALPMEDGSIGGPMEIKEKDKAAAVLATAKLIKNRREGN